MEYIRRTLPSAQKVVDAQVPVARMFQPSEIIELIQTKKSVSAVQASYGVCCQISIILVTYATLPARNYQREVARFIERKGAMSI